jgi:hypothetical protein
MTELVRTWMDGPNNKELDALLNDCQTGHAELQQLLAQTPIAHRKTFGSQVSR